MSPRAKQRLTCRAKRLYPGLLLALLSSGVRPVCADPFTFPNGPIQIAQPVIWWNVWARDPAWIATAQMWLNGERVPARYQLEPRRLVYQPARPLPPGDYTVRCRAVFHSTTVIEKTWQFVIKPGAWPTVPAPTAAQQHFLNTLNAVRHRLGLPDWHLNPNLCVAANAHIGYLQRTPRAQRSRRPVGDQALSFS